ncbi:beta-galactosidase trimerization domain-containing protein [Streptomyces sp. NPDC002577]
MHVHGIAGINPVDPPGARHALLRPVDRLPLAYGGDYHLEGRTAGHPALTRHALGDGAACYLATRLTGADLAAVVDLALADAGIAPAELPRDVELDVREGESGTFRFAVNHTSTEAKVLLPDATRAVVPAGAVEVFHDPR